MKSLGRVLFGLVGGLVLISDAAVLPRESVHYHEGFEAAPPNVTLWATNGEADVAFLGVTDEMAFEGKHAFKLDVTLKSGSYHYWGAPLHLPVAGELTMSAQIRVAPESTAQRIGFGTNMVYPPSTHSGCGPVKVFTKPTAAWERVDADLVERAATGKDTVVRRHTANLTGEDVGAVVDRWSLFIYGKPGQRAVVYVDAVTLQGRVPPLAAYREELDRRYAVKKAAFEEELTQWQRQVDEAKAAVAERTDIPTSFRNEAAAIKSSLDRAQANLTKAKRVGHASHDELDAVKQALEAARNVPLWVSALREAQISSVPFVAMPLPHAIANRSAATGLPLTRPPGEALACSACRGEIESVSFSVYALRDLSGLRVVPGALRGPHGSIGPDALDIYVIKAWYQGAGGIAYSPKRVLKPELLLKDADLVRVDHDKKHNYLRSTASDGSQSYILCSGPERDGLANVRPVDAAELQPVSVPAGSVQEFWVNVRVPDRVPPGTYSGKITIQVDETVLDIIPLSVTVYPFELLPPRLTYSIYYRAKLAKDGKPTISSEYKSAEQYRAEIADMKAHGVLYPTNYQSWNETALRRMLLIRQEAALPTGSFFNLGQGTGTSSEPDSLRGLQGKVRQWLKLCREFGYETVYFYGIDEAKGDRLAAQRAAWRAVQEAGGKTFVACYRKTFEAMGALLNCAVLAGPPDPREAEKWHSVGAQAFCYANPQVGVEAPETYRRNFGLVLWKAGFDGAMDYAYQHGFGHVWNDFDHTTYRDHNFTYPTINGVVATIQWEGFREAVDDVRYVTTLEAAIEKAQGAKMEEATAARRWLDALDPRRADLYEIRRQIADRITKLR